MISSVPHCRPWAIRWIPSTARTLVECNPSCSSPHRSTGQDSATPALRVLSCRIGFQEGRRSRRMVSDTIVVGHREDPGFGQLCDAVAFRQLVVVTGSGVSAELGNARSSGAPISTWHDVLKRLRNEFTDHLRGFDAHLDLLLNARPQNSEYLIEAATLIRGAVGFKPYRDAVVSLTTPRREPIRRCTT